MQVPDKDYHLSLNEEQQMEKGVPENQRKIYLGFIANFSIDDKSYENGAVALSENMITFFQRTLFGKSLKRVLSIHFLQIKNLHVIDQNRVEIIADKSKILIKTQIALKFSRQILKNFVYNLPFLPPEKRFAFTAYDYNQFPRIEPNLSASQAFQLTLNSYKAFYNTEYQHEFVQYFDTLMSTQSPIFDFNDMPIALIDSNFHKNTDFRSLFQTIRYCPFTFGIFCSDLSRPDIITNSVRSFASNSNIMIFRASNCKISHGLADLAKIMNSHAETNLLYLDLSGNPLEDVAPFFQAISNYTRSLASLRFENCNFHDAELTVLFTSLTNNKYIRGIRQICLSGNTFGISSTDAFLKFVRSLNEFNITNLKKLTLGPLPNPVPILRSIADLSKHLSVLHLYDVKFTDQALLELCKFTETASLADFDLTKCDLSAEKIVVIIQSIGRNHNYQNIRLGFNEMKITGQKMKFVIKEISEKIGDRLIGLRLNKNHCNEKDLTTLIRAYPSLPNLMFLSFNNNLKHGMPNLSYRLVYLISKQNLISLELKGSKSYCLQEELIPLLCSLQTNKALQALDISGHQIGSYGMQICTNVIRTNKALRRLHIDGTGSKFRFIRHFYKFVVQSSTLVECPFPIKDITREISIRESIGRATKKITKIQLIVSQKLLQNRHSQGISSYTLMGDPDLSKIGSMIKDDLIEALGELPKSDKSVKVNFGLPMPSEADHFSQSSIKQQRLALYNSLMIDDDSRRQNPQKEENNDFITIDEVMENPTLRSEFDSSEASMSTSEYNTQVKGGFIFDIPDEPESSSCWTPEEGASITNEEETEDSIYTSPPKTPEKPANGPSAFVIDMDFDDGADF
ncbi:Leucine Rich Repeat family protein [Trichomonas vaginalis G3]|uniref:Leucine Rich Repeat family protein n=1 Tax=Trichomonas vaginalis (strain ATCC PRA-98 / G3) TaxID=412133 RepID=A2E7J7_TRIV3|nr:uncharacterized protein TVAGG3_0339810 [Trichomonas vaginalis G3]EAY11390.1 Leucine Rich Repeat family protein [Trichomonas vaginalis G3]KAI5530555.1 barbed-end actin filament uncapping [Trichomonas vaginalis G3]|eukprot:XP_001323613.1 hypothetical protein [Trichomonas vaginalis G3]